MSIESTARDLANEGLFDCPGDREAFIRILEKPTQEALAYARAVVDFYGTGRDSIGARLRRTHSKER